MPGSSSSDIAAVQVHESLLGAHDLPGNIKKNICTPAICAALLVSSMLAAAVLFAIGCAQKQPCLPSGASNATDPATRSPSCAPTACIGSW